MTPNSKGLNEEIASKVCSSVMTNTAQNILMDDARYHHNYKVQNHPKVWAENVAYIKEALDKKDSEIATLKEKVADMKQQIVRLVKFSIPKEELDEEKEKVRVMTEALIAIKDSPGGGPGKRIATQALEDKV